MARKRFTAGQIITKLLEAEVRLKKLVADLSLDNQILPGVLCGGCSQAEEPPGCDGPLPPMVLRIQLGGWHP